MLTHLWEISWTYGWAGFLGLLCWTISGLCVYWNTLAKTDGKLKFFRFLIFSLVCGPVGLISFPVWAFFKLIWLIEIPDLARWLNGK